MQFKHHRFTIQMERNQLQGCRSRAQLIPTVDDLLQTALFVNQQRFVRSKLKLQYLSTAIYAWPSFCNLFFIVESVYRRIAIRKHLVCRMKYQNYK